MSLVNHRDMQSPLRQIPGEQAAGNPGADDGNGFNIIRGWWCSGAGGITQCAGQHVPFLAKSGCFSHGKASSNQPSPHLANGCKGGDRRAGLAVARHRVDDFTRPHARIFSGRETVQEPGIRLKIQLTPGIGYVAEKQGQPDVTAGEYQAMGAGDGGRILFKQLVSVNLELRPHRKCSGKVLRSQRVAFGGDEMQAAVAWCGCFIPGLPGCEEIQASAKPSFRDDEGGGCGQ